jgi:uncharacterized Zn-finger protein
MTPFETIEIAEMVAACAGGPGGGGSPMGHPRVYLSLAPLGRVECPYCSRLFVNPAVLRSGGVAPEAGVSTPSGHGPGEERQSDPRNGPQGPAVRGPAPRQVGDVAGGSDG